MISSVEFMSLKSILKIIGFGFIILILGCSRSPDLSTPERIGDKERVREIIGKQAARVVDKMAAAYILQGALDRLAELV